MNFRSGIKSLIVGPYIGSFNDEVTMFRPFFYWLTALYPQYKIYVCSKLDRGFLYPEKYFVPWNIFDKKKYYDEHGKFIKIEFSQIKKNLRNYVANLENIQIKELDLITFPQNYSLQLTEDYKRHVKISSNCDYYIKENKAILIVKHNDVLLEQYKELVNKYNNIELVIDDDFNFEWIFSKLKRTKCCFTNISVWAFIANLEKETLFYWGESVSKFKNGAEWEFENKNKLIFPMNIDKENVKFYLEKIETEIKRFLKKFV